MILTKDTAQLTREGKNGVSFVFLVDSYDAFTHVIHGYLTDPVPVNQPWRIWVKLLPT